MDRSPRRSLRTDSQMPAKASLAAGGSFDTWAMAAPMSEFPSRCSGANSGLTLSIQSSGLSKSWSRPKALRDVTEGSYEGREPGRNQ